MTFLSHITIGDKLDTLIKTPEKYHFKPEQSQPSSFELRLGSEVFISGEKKLIKLGPESKSNSYDIAIKPGEFAILITLEEISIPLDLMAFISVKTTYKNMGLMNISGFHVDPGFNGKLTFSVYNAGPGDIILRYGEPLFIIFFANLDYECKEAYSGEHKFQEEISARDMNKLTGKPVSLTELQNKLNSLQNTTNIQWGLLVAFAIGVILAFIKVIFTP